MCFLFKYTVLYLTFFLQTLLQFSVSHDPSEIILICLFGDQETFHIHIINEYEMIIIMKTVVLLNIFMETMMHSFQESDKKKVQKNNIYLTSLD